MSSSLGVVQTVLAVVMVVALVAALAWFLLRRKVSRGLVLRHPPVEAALFPDGDVASVLGEVVAMDEGFAAPVGGAACVYFQVELRFHVPNGGYTVIASEEAGRDFRVLDATGEVMVRLPPPVRAPVNPLNPTMRTVFPKVSFDVDTEHSWSRDELDPARWAAAIGRFGYVPDQLTADAQYELRESVLRPGDRIVVRGRGVRQLEGGTRAMVLSATEGDELHIVSKPAESG